MTILKTICRRQTGAALVIVMIMMALGGLMVVPLMNWMTGGLKTIQIYDNKNDLLYAADSGIQKGLWKITSYTSAPAVNFSDTIPAFTMNGMSVTAAVSYVWILDGVVDPIFGPHNQWMDVKTTGNASLSGVYTINLSYNDITGNPGNKKIDTMGVWLPRGFAYVTGSASDALSFPNNIKKSEPTVTRIHAGTSLKWSNVGYSFKSSGEVATEKFRFTPVGELPAGDVAWIASQSSDIGLSWDNMIWNYTITSTATDPTSGKTTQIIAHVTRDSGTSSGLATITYEIQ